MDYCKNVQNLIKKFIYIKDKVFRNLFKKIGQSYRAEYWRLFIDFSKTSMKLVALQWAIYANMA